MVVESELLVGGAAPLLMQSKTGQGTYGTYSGPVNRTQEGESSFEKVHRDFSPTSYPPVTFNAPAYRANGTESGSGDARHH